MDRYDEDEIEAAFGGTVDFMGDNRVIFDFDVNKYRVIVRSRIPTSAA